MFPASKAVTVTLNAAPAVADAGAETVKCVAAPGVTVTVAVEMLPVPPSFDVTVTELL